MRILNKLRHLMRMEAYENQSKLLLRFFVVYRYLARKMNASYSKKGELHSVGQVIYNVNEIIQSLEDIIEANLGNVTPDKQTDKIHLITPRHSEKAHGLIGQKTLSLALLVRYKETENQKYLALLKEVLDYCLVYQEKEGVFRYHNPIGLPQDEGPVTAGLIQAYCQAYQLTDEDRYLSAAIHAAEASITLLFQQQYGFLHTRFDEIETTNVNSSFALAFFDLYETTKDVRWLEWVKCCVEHVIRMQNMNGSFAYTNIKRTVYKASYHFLVLMSLMSIQERHEKSPQVQESIRKAIVYAKSLIRADGSVIEDSMTVHSWAPSCARAILFADMINDSLLVEKLAVNLSSHFSNNNQVYLDKENQMLSDDSRADLKILSIADMYYDLCRVSPGSRNIRKTDCDV